MEFAYKGTQSTLLIGKRAEQTFVKNFDETRSWIGFFGTQGTDRIHQLGFVVQDMECTEQEVKEVTEDEEVVEQKEAVSEEESGGNSVMLIVIGLASGVIILFITVWICICQCRRKRVKFDEKNKIQVIENNFDPRAEDDDSESPPQDEDIASAVR